MLTVWTSARPFALTHQRQVEESIPPLRSRTAL